MNPQTTMFSELRESIPERLRPPLRRVRAAILSVGLPNSGYESQPEIETQASMSMSVIVPVHDAPQFVGRCLASLERNASRAEVILVDDGSQLKETRDLLVDFCERNGWIQIRKDRASGHSRACETGAEHSTRPYLCLLNSDTVVTPWSWRAAQEAFEEDDRIGISGPSTSSGSIPQQIRRAECCSDYWSDRQIDAFASAYIRKRPPRSRVDLEEVGGFAFFIRRDLWVNLGGFDLRLPDYGNEKELCRRAVKRGVRIVWTQNSYIHHFGQKSYGQSHLTRCEPADRYIFQKHGS